MTWVMCSELLFSEIFKNNSIYQKVIISNANVCYGLWHYKLCPFAIPFSICLFSFELEFWIWYKDYWSVVGYFYQHHHQNKPTVNSLFIIQVDICVHIEIEIEIANNKKKEFLRNNSTFWWTLEPISIKANFHFEHIHWMHSVWTNKRQEPAK